MGGLPAPSAATMAKVHVVDGARPETVAVVAPAVRAVAPFTLACVR